MRKLTFLRRRTGVYYSMILSIICSFQLFNPHFLYSQQILIEPTIVSQPDAPIMEGDSICYSVVITNLTEDTIKDLSIVIDPMVTISLAKSTLLPGGSFTSSGSSITGSGCYYLTAADAGQPFIYNTFSGSGTICGNGSMTPFGPLTVDSNGGFMVPSYACFEPLVCIRNVNVSIDENCLLTLTPAMLLDSVYYPDSIYSIVVKDEFGNVADPLIFMGEEIGKKYTYELSIPSCPDLPGCWGYLNIEYKLAPDIVCITDTLDCFQFAQYVFQDPNVVSICSEPEIIASGSTRVDLCGVKPGFVAKVTTKYRIRDAFGNFSDTCTQEVYLRETIIDSLTKSPQFKAPPISRTVECGTDIFDTNGKIKITITDAPRWNGRRLDSFNDLACNFYTDYEDSVIDTFDTCDQLYQRKWNIREWRCNGGYKNHEFMTLIRIRDTKAPEIVAADSINRAVTEFDCTARFEIPPAQITDDCQSTLFIKTIYEGGIINGNGGRADIPIGNTLIIYEASDLCGNTSRDTLKIRVFDNTDPVAICQDEYIINVSTATATVTFDQLDEASYDACGPLAQRVVRRMSSPCNPQDTIFGPSVEFCCADGGNIVPVITRIYDMSGNFAECMTMVRVVEQSATLVEGPPNLELSCDFTYADSSVFGWIRVRGTEMPLAIPSQFVKDSSGPLTDGNFFNVNCTDNITVRELPVRANIDTRCGSIGTITRRFQIFKGSTLIDTKTQTIRITGDERTNPLIPSFFPPDATINSCPTADNVTPSLLGEPVVADVGCSLVGVGYKDTYATAANPQGTTCMKILRKWHAIDWCRDPKAENLIELGTQTIFVNDITAPVFDTRRDTIKENITSPDGLFQLLASASADDCVNGRNLFWEYTLRNNSGGIIQSGNSNTDNKLIGQNGNPSKQFALGRGLYRLTWQATDKCGNTSSFTVTIAINRAGQPDVCPACSNNATSNDNQVVTAFIQGQVIVSDGAEMDNVEVHLVNKISSDDNTAMTNLDGEYAFGDMPLGGQYVIDPKKVDGVLNGVSTLDMILMQKHVLGLQSLRDPVSLIAADVNNDGIISAFDLVEMRSVILGKKASFTNNDSWRFVWQGQDLAAAIENDDNLVESYNVDPLENDMIVDFVGIKVGDVTGDAIGNSALAKGRSNKIDEWTLSSSNNLIALKSTDTKEYTGLQMEFNVNGLSDKIIDVQSNSISLSPENWYLNIDQEKLVVTWNGTTSAKVLNGQTLFEIIMADDQFDVSSVALDQSRIKAESYDQKGLISQITLSSELSLSEMSLSHNNPNPWTDFTTFELKSETNTDGMIRIYDMHNRLILEHAQRFTKGPNQIRVSSNEVQQSGVYFIDVEANGTHLRQKMLRVN